VPPPHLIAYANASRPSRPARRDDSYAPCYAVTLGPAVTTITERAYSELLETHPDGTVTTDTALLERLLSAIRARARARGSCHATELDVRDAAALFGRANSHVASPADALPSHNERLQSELAQIHADVARFKSLGGRAPTVLVCGETSGVIATAFTKAGADVATCDLDPSSNHVVPHFTGHFAYLCDLGFDLVIGHPPCQYLSNAGAQYLKTEAGRTDRLNEAITVFKRMHASNAPFVAIEQPIVHGSAKRLLNGLTPDQYVQPFEHGTGHYKTTGLYLTGSLPKLTPTCPVPGRERAMKNLAPGP